MLCVIDSLRPDYFSFITPSRWMVGGKGLEKFRTRMMSDRRFRTIVHFDGERTIFPTVQVIGGVNYFLWEKDYSGKCRFVNGNTVSERFLDTHDIILQDNSAFDILEKIQKAGAWVSEKCLPHKPFGLRTNFSDFKDNGVKCLCERKVVKFVAATAFTDKAHVVDKWKVCIPVGAGGHQIPDSSGAKVVIMNVFIIEPGAVCTETYLVLNTFSTKNEAQNFVSYVRTKFFRFLAGLRMVKNSSRKVFSWVPDVEDYTTAWTDEELYDMFGLTRQERAYIESKIKELPYNSRSSPH